MLYKFQVLHVNFTMIIKSNFNHIDRYTRGVSEVFRIFLMNMNVLSLVTTHLKQIKCRLFLHVGEIQLSTCFCLQFLITSGCTVIRAFWDKQVPEALYFPLEIKYLSSKWHELPGCKTQNGLLSRVLYLLCKWGL